MLSYFPKPHGAQKAESSASAFARCSVCDHKSHGGDKPLVRGTGPPALPYSNLVQAVTGI